MNGETQQVHTAQTCGRARRAIQDTLEILSGKWKLPIIYTLTFGTYRFKELAREVGISPRMLSKELKDMEMNKLVSRKVHDTMPITVEYSITPYGKTLKSVLEELKSWGEKHREMIMAPELAEK